MARRWNLGIAAWKSLMRDTITVVNPSSLGRDMFGRQHYPSTAASGTPGVKYSCHIRFNDMRTRKLEGLDEDARYTIWVASTASSAIGISSRVILADGSLPPLLSCDYGRDENGILYTRLDCG